MSRWAYLERGILQEQLTVLEGQSTHNWETTHKEEGKPMTHTLHRQGSVQSLKEDYVVFYFGEKPAPGFLATQKARLRKQIPHIYAMLKFLKRVIVEKPRISSVHEPKEGPTEGFEDRVVLHSKEELFDCVKMLKEANTGQSAVVSGLVQEVSNCLRELHLCPHTIQFSLGHFGKTELLPNEEILETTTMCGHHMISPRLVEKLASDVGKGRITPEEASEAMAKLCACRIFNKARAVKTIQALIK